MGTGEHIRQATAPRPGGGRALRWALAVVLVLPTLAAATGALEALRAVRTLKCLFNAGIVGAWDGPRVKRELTTTVDMAYHFHDIDRAAGKASMVGSEGTRSVEVVDSAAGLTFVDRTLSGNLSFTTVFAQQLPGGNFSAVHSRHVLLMSEPLPSQYYGICRQID